MNSLGLVGLRGAHTHNPCKQSCHVTLANQSRPWDLAKNLLPPLTASQSATGAAVIFKHNAKCRIHSFFLSPQSQLSQSLAERNDLIRSGDNYYWINCHFDHNVITSAGRRENVYNYKLTISLNMMSSFIQWYSCLSVVTLYSAWSI